MAYTEPVQDLDVLGLYTEIMQVSTAQGSAYLHAKETLEELLAGNDMAAEENSAVIP